MVCHGLIFESFFFSYGHKTMIQLVWEIKYYAISAWMLTTDTYILTKIWKSWLTPLYVFCRAFPSSMFIWPATHPILCVLQILTSWRKYGNRDWHHCTKFLCYVKKDVFCRAFPSSMFIWPATHPILCVCFSKKLAMPTKLPILDSRHRCIDNRWITTGRCNNRGIYY